MSEILDFGCAVGFLVDAFNGLGYFCRGYDKSSWAVEYGTKMNVQNLTTDYNDSVKAWWCGRRMTLALDVFEHMTPVEVRKVLLDVNTTYLTVRIPVCANDGEDFVLPVSRNDPTHITCMSKDSWKLLLSECGFHVVTLLSLNTIWDSPGVLSAIFYRSLS